MVQRSDSERILFEAAIYNRIVRSMIKDNRSHPFFDDRWADGILVEVPARNEADARARLARRYPPELGFVVAALVLVRVPAAA